MTLDKQVISLELAKKLKELGVKQESVWWWEHHIFNGREHRKPDSIILRLEKDTETCDGKRVEFKTDVYQKTYYSAFTVAELGEMLPKTVEKGKLLFHLKIYYENLRKWAIQYIFWHCGCSNCSCGTKKSHKEEEEWLLDDSLFADTEANARVKMLIWLIENKKITKGE